MKDVNINLTDDELIMLSNIYKAQTDNIHERHKRAKVLKSHVELTDDEVKILSSVYDNMDNDVSIRRKAGIIILRNVKVSIRAIGTKLCCSHGYIERVCTRYNRTGIAFIFSSIKTYTKDIRNELCANTVSTD